MSSIEAVIFDLDGLMVENESIQLESFNRTLTEHGVNLTKNDFLCLVGKTQKEIFEEIKKRFGIHENIKSLAARKRKEYLDIIEKKLIPRPGLKQLIDWVNKRNLRKGIASSSPKEDVVAVLRVIGLNGEFDSIVSSFELPNGKPYPDIFIKAAKDLCIKRDRCIVLEDSEIGVQAAKQAGMRCIAVPSSFTKHQDFSEADYLANNLSEAKKILEDWYNNSSKK